MQTCPEKSTRWTDTCVDQNFQRNLGVIGPYEFQGKFAWTNGSFALFSGTFAWTNGAESLSNVFPLRTALVHGCLFPVV